jgi:hypothetical protein
VKKFQNWLEEVSQLVSNDIIETLKKAIKLIGEYGGFNVKAASEADALIRGVRGYYKMAYGSDMDPQIVSILTQTANICNALSHLAPDKNEKIKKVQNDLNYVIQKLA